MRPWASLVESLPTPALRSFSQLFMITHQQLCLRPSSCTALEMHGQHCSVTIRTRSHEFIKATGKLLHSHHPTTYLLNDSTSNLTTSLTIMKFFLTTIIFTLCALSSFSTAAPISAELLKRDVFDPPVISPGNGTVWKVGTKQTVTW